MADSSGVKMGCLSDEITFPVEQPAGTVYILDIELIELRELYIR
jgi:hypothetical protein